MSNKKEQITNKYNIVDEYPENYGKLKAIDYMSLIIWHSGKGKTRQTAQMAHCQGSGGGAGADYQGAAAGGF